ncbi:hypothetical protein AK95_04345 [Paenibacillus sp. LC231]|uniref:hypothetical protein n=1 Tax=Paenibacillus sp. LC231 TaxID=1120679 RepID=UPI0008DE2896|nr:hypothetical protein [Paenibacillus sp. LC231]OIB02147.1 hypothetical protein AK95_04345 [Paenibacillus sp. LC231]
MKKIIMSVLAVSFFTATVAFAAASPEFVPDEKFTEVKTSGVEKAWVGPDQGDDTIIIDSEGNQTTAGELRAQFNINFQEIKPDAIDQLQTLPGNEKNEIKPPDICDILPLGFFHLNSLYLLYKASFP